MKNLKYLVLILFTTLVTSCEKKLPSTTTIVKVNLIDANNNPIEGYTFQIGGSYPKGLSAVGTINEYLKTDKFGNIVFEKLITKPTKNVNIKPIADVFTDQILYKTLSGNFELAGNFILGIGVLNEINYKLIKK
jgi:hypothetical protein